MITGQRIISKVVPDKSYYLEGVNNQGEVVYQFAIADNLQELKELRTKMITENPELTFLIKQLL